MTENIKKNYLIHVDGLRAIAVLSVFLFHLDISLFSGGYVGVDVFFVISGFLILGILKDELDKTKSINFRVFIIKRIMRLYPTLIIVSAVTFLFSILLFSPLHLQRIGGAVATSLFNFSNVFFWLESDYFDTSAKLKPFLHTWSLSIEWQFYIFLSFIVFLIYKFSFNRMLFPILCFVCFFSFFLNFKFSKGAPLILNDYFPSIFEFFNSGKSALFFLVFFRIFEFFIGGFIIWGRSLILPNRILYDVFFITGLLFIIYSVFLFDDEMLFPYYFALLPCIGAALVIYSGDKAFSKVIVTNKLFVWVGLLSYSIYLVHWPIIVFWSYLDNISGILPKILIIFLSFLFSVFLYRFIEEPLRKKDIMLNKKTWMVIAITFLSIFIVGLHAYKHKGWMWRVSIQSVNLEGINDPQEFRRKYYGGVGYPSYGTIENMSSPNIVVFGDSHGRHYAEGLYQEVAKPNNLSLYMAAGTSCFHLPNFTRTTDDNNWDAKCPQGLNTGLSYVKSAKQPTLIIVSHSWYDQMRTADLLDSKGQRLSIKITVNEIIKGLKDLKEQVGDVKILVIGNIPQAGTNLFDIFTKPRSFSLFGDFDPDSYLFTKRNSLFEEMNLKLKEAGEKNAIYTFVDPFDYLCDEEKCRNTDDLNNLIYSDRVHLSKSGSIFIVNKIKPLIIEMIEAK